MNIYILLEYIEAIRKSNVIWEWLKTEGKKRKLIKPKAEVFKTIDI